ncbi:SufE family protein [Georgenia sp. H159]|uniref:SufE family protein n=1 Tax=Georgenia sp. H159 TaxID=3076115 RepID=UPI002D79758D|nr:SufE family protein [Georgenia sp. H159]
MSEAALPARFAALVGDFLALAPPDRVALLIELGDDLPELPEHLRSHPELLEPVTECQSPLSVLAVVEHSGAGAVVRLHVAAAPHAPVTRGFAGVLHTTLDGSPASEVLALPGDVAGALGLDGVVSPLRLRGFTALLARVQRQVAVGTQGVSD